MDRIMIHAFKNKTLMFNHSYCNIGTNTLESHKGAVFKHGSFQMVDPRYPSVQLSMRMDHQTASSDFFGKSISNKREVITYRDGDKIK